MLSYIYANDRYANAGDETSIAESRAVLSWASEERDAFTFEIGNITAPQLSYEDCMVGLQVHMELDGDEPLIRYSSHAYRMLDDSKGAVFNLSLSVIDHVASSVSFEDRDDDHMISNGDVITISIPVSERFPDWRIGELTLTVEDHYGGLSDWYVLAKWTVPSEPAAAE